MRHLIPSFDTGPVSIAASAHLSSPSLGRHGSRLHRLLVAFTHEGLELQEHQFNPTIFLCCDSLVQSYVSAEFTATVARSAALSVLHGCDVVVMSHKDPRHPVNWGHVLFSAPDLVEIPGRESRAQRAVHGRRSASTWT